MSSSNITFITAFKKFKKSYDMIQQSAMYSWKINGIPVKAPTNEVDTRGKCTGYGNITLIEGVKRGREIGFPTQSPIVPDLIAKALPVIDTVMVAYINSDIIITENFVEKIQRMVDKYGYDIFVVGSRNEIDLKEYANTPKTYKKVLEQKREAYDDSTSSDIFIASKFNWRKVISEMPEFILGRWGWDNYLHMMGEVHKLKKYNCSDALPILHCKHGFHHIFLQEKKHEREAPSSRYNLALWEKTRGMYGTTRIKAWPRIEL
jgi:hypothetical protein